MKQIWIKLYVEILNDPKMGKMPIWLWKRAIELFLLAGENGNGGLLQPVEDIAWRLRISETNLVESLQALSELGVVHETLQGWVVTHFQQRQAVPTSTQRVQEYRKRIASGKTIKRKEDEKENETEDVTEDVTEDETENETEDETEEKRSLSSSTSDSDSISFSASDSDSDSESLGDEVQEKGAGNAFAVFEANIAPITPMLADALRADIDDFSEAWVCDAIREAVKSNAYNLKYVEAILKRWQKDGRGTKKHGKQTENRGETYEDRQRYVTGKYKDWIKH